MAIKSGVNLHGDEAEGPIVAMCGVAREIRRNRSRAHHRLPASHVRSDETGCANNIIVEFFLVPASTTAAGSKESRPL